MGFISSSIDFHLEDENLFTKWEGFRYARDVRYAMGLTKIELAVIAVAMMIILFAELISERKKKELAQWLYEGSYLFRTVFCLGLIAMIFVCGKYGAGYDPRS